MCVHKKRTSQHEMVVFLPRPIVQRGHGAALERTAHDPTPVRSELRSSSTQYERDRAGRGSFSAFSQFFFQENPRNIIDEKYYQQT